MFNLKPLKTLVGPCKLIIPVFHVHNKTTPKISPLSNPAIDFFLNEAAQHLKRSESSSLNPKVPENIPQYEGKGNSSNTRVQISHPWPEWVGLMEKLLSAGYFDKIGHPFGSSEMGSKDFNQVRSACLNFAREHSDIVRFLSRKDIQVVAGAGCPSLDRKVVNSGKRLRAHVGIDEGHVCSSCILRGNCERAYVKVHEDEGGRTVDVMRILLTYGLDVVIESVENKPCLNKKVNESVRNLLKEVIAFSFDGHDREQPTATSPELSETKKTPGKQGDWNCPKCNFLNFGRNMKCLQCESIFQERLRKVNEELGHLPLKKGDWICDKCHFLNFAKNTRCLQCKEKPPKRVLNPGEWECESCNYINFKRNMVCLKCDHKRPKSQNSAFPPLQPAGDKRERRLSRPYFGQEKHLGDKEDEWKFVNNIHHQCSNTPDNVPGLMDFPVMGGKSEWSRDLHKQEMWKTEMAKQNISAVKAKENTDGFKSSLGGESEWSRNLHKQEMWRMEMAQQNRSAVKAKDNTDGFKSSLFQRNRQFMQSTDDDEEMAEWFGPKDRVQLSGG